MKPKPAVFHQASSFQLSIALCLARSSSGLVPQSSLHASLHPAMWAPPSITLVLLVLLLLLAVLGSGHLSVSAGLRESSPIFSASSRTSSGAGTTVAFCFLPKASIPVSCAASPGLGGGYCFPCRGSCPCAPSGAFSLACGEVSPIRASLLSSRDGAPGAIVGAVVSAVDSLSSRVSSHRPTISSSCRVARSSDGY